MFPKLAVLVSLALARVCIAAIVPMAEPAISPDRKEIAFVHGGDIWTVPVQGGEARVLVAHSANESRPLFSPDGKRLAFLSNRNGATNIYVLDMSAGSIQRVTFSDTTHLLDSWSRDGSWIYFSTAEGDVAGMSDIWRVKATGGTPQKVSADRYASEFHAAPAPDGKKLLFVGRGFGLTQWWRKGRSHLDESEIWLLDENAPEKDKQLLARGAKQLWPQWMPDGQSFYFVSDRNKSQQNIHQFTIGKGEKQITQFSGGRVLYPNLSYDGKALVFERDFAVWRMDTGTGKAEKVNITLRGAPAGPSATTTLQIGGISGLQISPDGKKAAFTTHGEVWAAPAKEGGPAFRVTSTPGPEGSVTWSSDSNQIVFVADRDGARQIVLYDFVKKETRELTSGPHIHVSPRFSPDGKKLAYAVDGKEIRVRTMADNSEKTIYTGTLGSGSVSMLWSPDSEWLAAYLPGVKNFGNVQLFKFDGSAREQISWLPNMYGGDLAWAPDGSAIYFNTLQRTERVRLAVVDLKPRAPEFREDQFRDLFKPPPPSGKKEEPSKKTELITEGIRDRLRLLPIGMSVGEPRISPDGKILLFLGDLGDQTNIYTYSLERNPQQPPVPRQLTSTSTNKNSLQWTSDSKTIYYLDNGRMQTMAVDTRQPRAITISGELQQSFEALKSATFQQAWMRMRDSFYDSKYHGADWNGEVKRVYGEAADGARTQDEMRRVLNLMVGELNASHLGVSGPPQTGSWIGRLGIDWDAAFYETNGKLKVEAVLPRSPAALAGGIVGGDVVTSIAGTKVDGTVDVNSLLTHTIGKEVEIAIEGKSAVRLRPISLSAEKSLRYDLWVEQRRDLVAKYSGGRLGYAHMADMSDNSLNKLALDLDATTHAKEGVVIDVRNNNGGFVNAYALDILSRRNYLNMQPRGFESAPARAMLGQRSIEKPTVLLTNQHSLSDAEDFSEGYRALGLGKIVGEPTAGWIIYTSNQPLIDGSQIRVPSVRVTTARGENMELHPRPVDIPVNRPMGESYRGTDIQLETAVKTLLGQIDGPTPSSAPNR